jgi:hypothetical protein
VQKTASRIVGTIICDLEARHALSPRHAVNFSTQPLRSPFDFLVESQFARVLTGFSLTSIQLTGL